MGDKNLNNSNLKDAYTYRVGHKPIRDTTGFITTHMHADLPLCSYEFVQLLAHIEKRMKYNVSFDPIGGSLNLGINEVGVRVPNSLYYVCILHINDAGTVGYKSPRLTRGRYNYDGKYRDGFSSKDIRRVANLVCRIKPIYDEEVIGASVATHGAMLERAMHADNKKLSNLDREFSEKLIHGYQLQEDVTTFIKQALQCVDDGRVYNPDPNNQVINKYEEYKHAKRELTESVNALGERMTIQVLKLYGRDEIILAGQNFSRFVRFASVDKLPETIQSAIHTVNTLASGRTDAELARHGYECAVGCMIPSRIALTETHYGVFLPTEDARPVLETLQQGVSYV